MRTQIDKRFNWGFFVSEQELRRLVDLAQSHMDKASPSPSGVKRAIEVHLSDGSIIETEQLDDVFGLENYGSKGIRSLDVAFRGEGEGAPTISFGLLEPTYFGWFDDESVRYSISGSSRDWAVIAASALEERLRKAKRVSWRRLFSRPNLSLGMLIVFLLSLVLTLLWIPKAPSVSFDFAAALEQQRSEGKIRDGVDAIIQLERLKASHLASDRPDSLFPFMFITVLVLLVVLSFALRLVVVRLLPSYAFYWGDNIGVLDRKRFWAKLVFLGIGLTVAVSMLSQWFFESLGHH